MTLKTDNGDMFVGVIKSRLFKYTQQHTVCFTALDSAPPKTGPDHQSIAEILLKVVTKGITRSHSLKKNMQCNDQARGDKQ
jgi:hypothetical protein